VADQATAFAPGRVNLIGEHTDYNDGLALPFAIAEGVTVNARTLTEPRIEARALDLGESDGFTLERPERVPGWRAFVRGAVAELKRAGVPLRGAALEITGEIHRGAGLSSSAALEVALCLALTAIADASSLDRMDLAQLCSRVENEWVGARTGLLDQLASLYGVPDHAVRIDFRSLDVQPVPLDLADLRLVALDSGERHSHTRSGYNERRAECARACDLLGLDSLRDATLEMADSLKAPLDKRVRHVVSENERVEQAVRALTGRDVALLGELLNASHVSLRDSFEVSTAAVERAVDSLLRNGALGARVVGGGFGGSVLGLLPADMEVPDDAIEVRPGPGARVLSG
jgi:galactokinase